MREALDRSLITDKHTEILVCIPCVMGLLLHSASQAQISTTTHQTFDLDLGLWPWPQALTLTFHLDLKASSKTTKLTTKHDLLPFDLDLWPTTLTYNPSLVRVKVDPHAKNQSHRSNDSNRRASTSKQASKRTDGHVTKRIISLALRSITNPIKVLCPCLSNIEYSWHLKWMQGDAHKGPFKTSVLKWELKCVHRGSEHSFIT